MPKGTEKVADLAAARHLLRHVQNPNYLRRNPLLRAIFPNAEKGAPSGPELCGIVLAAIESIKQSGNGADVHGVRQYEILTRYDVGRESRATISCDLGIGTRQFYYERRAALARLVEVLRDGPRQSVTAISAEDHFSVQHESAIALNDSGRSDLSISLLKNLATSVCSNAHRVTTLSTMVQGLCDAGRTGEAANALADADRLLRTADGTPRQSILLNARVAISAVRHAWVTGKVDRALHIGSRACYSLETISAGESAEANLLLAALLNYIGDIHSNAGRLEVAKSHFIKALAALSESSQVDSAMRATILANLAFVQGITPGGMAMARKANAEVLGLATRNGLLRNVAQAHVNELQFHYWRGDVRKSLTHARIAQAITDAVCGAVERGRVAILHGRVEAFCGHGRAGLQRVRAARKCLPRHSYLWVLSKIIESEVLIHMQAYDAAVNVSLDASKCADEIHSARGKGMAALAMAQAYEARGEFKRALQLIEDSIPALEESSGLFPLSQALGCRARLSNDSRFANAAAELQGSFRT